MTIRTERMPPAAEPMDEGYPWVVPMAHKRNGRYRIGGDSVPEVVIWNDGARPLAREVSPHPDLAAMVARALGVALNNLRPTYFFLNEWRHVLVRKGDVVLFAGRYDHPLIFVRGDGERVTPEAPRSLEPGQIWPGPRVGMRYALTATGTDVYGKRQSEDGLDHVERLSAYVPGVAPWVTSWGGHKPGGGAVYINEARELFGPRGDLYVYFGYAPLDMWFPRPDVEAD